MNNICQIENVDCQKDAVKLLASISYMLLKGMLQEYWKIDMFLETFRLLACAISNFDLSPCKDY